ncbi:MAG TPA: META domain-containing protein [Vicinamibacteria bacterium]|nr:META domain-containing protein [Vicinamibacteria bacterium]
MKAGRIVRGGMGVVLGLGLVACGADGPPELPSAPGSGSSARTAGLLGAWQLVSLREAGGATIEIAEPAIFQAEFQADGRLSLVADCNRCSGTYEAGERTLSVTPMACTRAACPSMPLDTTYASLVGSATAWEATADRLELHAPEGNLRFRR